MRGLKGDSLGNYVTPQLQGKVKLLRLGWPCACVFLPVVCVCVSEGGGGGVSKAPETSDYLAPGPVVKCQPSEKYLRVVWPVNSDIMCCSAIVFFFKPPISLHSQISIFFIPCRVSLCNHWHWGLRIILKKSWFLGGDPGLVFRSFEHQEKSTVQFHYSGRSSGLR